MYAEPSAGGGEHNQRELRETHVNVRFVVNRGVEIGERDAIDQHQFGDSREQLEHVMVQRL